MAGNVVGNQFGKKPGEEEWFGIDWRKRLAGVDPLIAPDTIASSTWQVDEALTVTATLITDGVTGVKLAGGVHGTNYTVVNTIVTTVNTETLQEAIVIRVIAP